MSSIKTRSLLSKISALLGEKRMSDVTFVVGNPPTVFSCHKLLLAVNSEVFSSMFYGSMPENDVYAPDITSKAFKIVLEFCYTDEVKFTNVEEAFDVAYAGKKYMMPCLYRISEEYLISNIKFSCQNVCSVYEDADYLNMVKLKHKAMNYMCKHFDKVFHPTFLTSVRKSTLIDVLESRMLELCDISESCILETICAWSHKYCKNSGNNFVSMRKTIADLLYYVQIPLISQLDIERVTKTYDISYLIEELQCNAGIIDLPRVPRCSKTKRSLSNCDKMELPVHYRYNDTNYRYTVPTGTREIIMKVPHGQVTLVGFILTLKPIPEYSKSHRLLKIAIECINRVNGLRATVQILTRPKEDSDEVQEQQLVLDEFLTVSSDESCTLRVTLESEGILLPQLASQDVVKTLKSTKAILTMPQSNNENLYCPVKDIMCMFHD